MKRFKFELEALLTIRKRATESIKEELAYKNGQIQEEQARFESIKEELAGFQEEQRLRRDTESNLMNLRYSVNYRNKLKMDLLDCGKTVQNLQRDAYIITERLVKATQEQKAIEMLREKRYLEWKKERNSAEQRFIDDVSGQRYIRNRKGAADAAQ